MVCGHYVSIERKSWRPCAMVSPWQTPQGEQFPASLGISKRPDEVLPTPRRALPDRRTSLHA